MFIKYSISKECAKNLLKIIDPEIVKKIKLEIFKIHNGFKQPENVIIYDFLLTEINEFLFLILVSNKKTCFL